MKKLGLDIGDFVQLINNGIAIGHETNQSELNPFDSYYIPELNTTVIQVASHAAFQGGASIIAAIFEVRVCASIFWSDTDSAQNFDEPQDTSEVIGSLIEYLSNTAINRTDFPYSGIYGDILALAYAYNATPTLWFFGSGVSTLDIIPFKITDTILVTI